MTFPEISFLGRQRIRVFGRCLFLTNSGTVEFTDIHQREGFPLVVNDFTNLGSYLLPDGKAWCFPIEADGWLLVAQGALHNLLETGLYSRFEYDPSSPKVVSFFAIAAAPVGEPLVSRLTPVSKTPNGVLYQADMSDSTSRFYVSSTFDESRANTISGITVNELIAYGFFLSNSDGSFA